MPARASVAIAGDLTKAYALPDNVSATKIVFGSYFDGASCTVQVGAPPLRAIPVGALVPIALVFRSR
jgi:hypothetical protein